MTKNNIKKNVLISTLGGYFVSLFNFTLNLLIIRNLSPELYGLFSYIVNQSRRTLRFLDFSSRNLTLVGETSLAIEMVSSSICTSTIILSTSLCY